MSRKKVTTYPVFTWPTHALLKRSLTSLLPSYYLLVWILQSSLSHSLMIGLTTVSSPSRAMFYSVETVRLVEAAFALLFHPASPSKGGLIWSHQIMNACGCGFVLRACLVHSLTSSVVLCTSLKHPLTYNGLVLVISSSELTLLSPLTLAAG